MRVESPSPTRNGGWYHRLRETNRTDPLVRRFALRRLPDWSQLVAERRAETTDADLARRAHELAVTVDTLRVYSCFASKRWPAALCIPMRDALGRVVGVRVRARAHKWSASGGGQGLFVPDTSADRSSAEPLLLVEGASDAFIGHELGFWTVGRPSATGGARIVSDIVRIHAPPCVVVVADNDVVGRQGADALAQALRLVCLDVRVVTPPERHKDLRDAVRVGFAREDLLARIEGAAPLVPLRLADVTA